MVAWSSDIFNFEEWLVVLIVELVNTSFSVELDLEGLVSVVVGLSRISSVCGIDSVVELLW